MGEVKGLIQNFLFHHVLGVVKIYASVSTRMGGRSMFYKHLLWSFPPLVIANTDLFQCKIFNFSVHLKPQCGNIVFTSKNLCTHGESTYVTK